MNWLTILAPSVSLAELVVRGTVIFLVLLALLRVVGQRESGGLGITDVLLIVLSQRPRQLVSTGRPPLWRTASSSRSRFCFGVWS